MNKRKATAKTAPRPAAGKPAQGGRVPFEDRLRGWLRPLHVIWAKSKNLARTNYELGLDHMRHGNIVDAAMRFRMVTWLDPKHADAWYALGCCEMDRGRTELAHRALEKAVKMMPDNENARFMFALAGGKVSPARMPLMLAQNQFDGLAEHFDEDQKARSYTGPEALQKAVLPQLAGGRNDYVMLELGPGTGLVGPLFKPRAARLVGVDLSAKMIAIAGQRKNEAGNRIYDELVQKDAVSYLQSAQEGAFDVIYAADLVSFMGDLSQLFAGAARALKPDGILAFTGDPTGGSFKLEPVLGRFAHSEAYLREQAGKAGLESVSFDTAQLYAGHNMFVCVFRKG